MTVDLVVFELAGEQVEPGAPVVAGPRGPAGAEGPPGVSAGVAIVQASPAAEATFTHQLGRLPNVAVYIAGVDVETDVAATTTTVIVTFPAPTAFVLVLT